MREHRKVSALVSADVAGATELLKQFQATVSKTVDGMSQAGTAAGAAVTQTAKSFAPVGQALDATVAGVVRGSIKSSQAFSTLGDRLLASELTMNARRLASFVGTETAKTAASLAGVTQRNAIEAAGTAQGKAAHAAAATSSILTDAHKAAAGAFSAVAGIPYIGPVLAPAAAAAAFAGVMAFDVVSAAGGIERVPYDGMPALLHANESVLPARIAMPLMELATSGPPKGWGLPALPALPTQAAGGGGGAAAPGSPTNIHFHTSMSAQGIGAGDFAHRTLSALNDHLRTGTSAKYPAIARLMQRGR